MNGRRLLSLDQEPFGATDRGDKVDVYRLRSTGLELSILTYGGIIQSIHLPDRAGRNANVVLGFSELAGYLAAPDVYFGAVIGRYANRIARGEFVLDGIVYQLSQNEGEHHLHGGSRGFDKKVWQARPRVGVDEVAVVLSHSSRAGEEGYPGELEVEVVYSLTADGVFRIRYRATTTEPTVLSLTNHSLFNLEGEGSGNILEHELEIEAHRYTPTNEDLITTGELAPVAGTPFDFRWPLKIGASISQPAEQLAIADGYDHNYVLNRREGDGPSRAARLFHRQSGRALEIRTTEPGLQLYSGNRLDGTLTGQNGSRYAKFAGVALETQRFPDSPNHAHFPSPVLRPGTTYESTTELRFSVEAE